MIGLNRRHRDILNIILNTDGYITGNELSKLFNITIRTIRKDIKEINILLSDINIEIEANVKKGYFLNKKGKEILKENNIIRGVLDYKYTTEPPNLPTDRKMYILLTLTMKEYISIEELAKSLFVSESTINNDIIYLNKWLKKNLKLGISNSLNKGVSIKANEVEKRNIISRVLAIRLNISTVLKYWSYLFEDRDIIKISRNIYRIINVELKKHKYYLSGHSYQLFCYEILIAVNRQKMGFNLDNLKDENNKIIPVIGVIRERVREELGINLSEEEWLNLQRYFKSKQFIRGTDIRNIETEDTICVVDEFIKTLSEKFKINLLSNLDNRYKLILYLAPMINRLKYKHCISNKIDKKIIQTYKTEYKMAIEIVPIIKTKLNLDVDLIDLVYITIHLISMCERVIYKFNAILVCDYDESILSFIEDKIKSCFGDKIKICRSYDYLEFMYEDEKNFENIDFIITTSTIADITNIPFVRISPQLDPNDIDMITEYINFCTNKLKYDIR